MNTAPSIAGFRLRLLIGMMLVVCVVTALVLWIARHKVTDDVQQKLQQVFRGEIATLHRAWEVRHAALVERTRALARKPRIHAALEDNALDLLYPNAEDELRDVMQGDADANHPLRARFYRFLDAEGKVLAAPPGVDAGRLSADEEASLSLAKLPDTQQVGYLKRNGGMDEIIAAPILSTETNEVIASIVLGFKPFHISGQSLDMKAGIWTNGLLSLPEASAEARTKLAAVMSRAPAGPHDEVTIDGVPHLVFSQLLNPGSLFPPAYEVCMYSFADAVARRQHLRWQILGAGALMLLGAGVASHFIAGRLSAPVERLAVHSASNVKRREQAEAALEQTSVELQRSTRFSADASHQLKTPVTVLRAGLEELQAGADLTQETREEISTLIHQTFRLTSMIEDLLLLSRMDAGALHIDYQPIDVSHLIAGLIDDLSAMPAADDIEVETEVPPDLSIPGDLRYITIILQNLLENARKYNRPGGLIRITAEASNGDVIITVGNTGTAIPPEAQAHIFERFHRGMSAENVPGHGLGLNLARELARTHGGELVLAGSKDDWTEFELRLRAATVAATAPA